MGPSVLTASITTLVKLSGSVRYSAPAVPLGTPLMRTSGFPSRHSRSPVSNFTGFVACERWELTAQRWIMDIPPDRLQPYPAGLSPPALEYESARLGVIPFRPSGAHRGIE